MDFSGGDFSSVLSSVLAADSLSSSSSSGRRSSGILAKGNRFVTAGILLASLSLASDLVFLRSNFIFGLDSAVLSLSSTVESICVESTGSDDAGLESVFSFKIENKEEPRARLLGLSGRSCEFTVALTGIPCSFSPPTKPRVIIYN